MDIVSSVISLLNFAVDTLGFIQLAVDFKDDFAAYQLKLDILQIRLSRWGEFTSSNKDGYNLDGVKDVLEEIQDRLSSAKANAESSAPKPKRLQIGASQPKALDPETEIPMHLRKIRNRFKEFLRRRKAQVSNACEGIKWVFYKKEHFDDFVQNMSGLLDELEKTIPEADREKLRQLSDEECKGLSKANLEELKKLIGGCDPWLEKSVDQILKDCGGRTVINQSYNKGHVVGVHNGDNKGVAYGKHSTLTNNFH